MKRNILLIVLCLCFFVYANGFNRMVINVPQDYDTIQEAIDAASDGDEIIVSPGTYFENINFYGKAVTLGSLFYTTQDTSYISQTIIDGGENGSVVTFENEESAESVLTGFTITNGFTENYGGGIFTSDYCSPTLNNLRIISNHADTGGGYYFGEYCNSELANLLVADNTAHNGAGGAYSYYCEQIMEDSVIRGNVSDGNGGAICCDEADLSFNNVVMEDNTAGFGGGLHQTNGHVSLIDVNIQGNQAGMAGGLACYGETYLESVNIFENSALSSGGGIWCTYFPLEFCEEMEGRCNLYNNYSESGLGNDIFCHNPQEIILNTFSVENPTDYYAAPGESFTFDVIDGFNPQIDGDVYVSANGSNENSGLNADQPLQTIRQACSLMAVSEENPHTIYLGAGTYSTSETGENYPIHLPDNVFLRGVNRENVILDAEGNSQVIELTNADNVGVRGLTVCNGNYLNGGGIHGYYAHAELSELIVRDNHASGRGGGIDLSYGNSILRDLLVYGNSAVDDGGGISVGWNGLSVMHNVTVWGNNAGSQGGGMFINYSQANIINSIFSSNEPEAIYCYGYNTGVSLAYTDIDGGSSEIYVFQGQPNLLEGMIYEDPQFVDAENGDFRLADDSPCIDMGTPYFEYEDQVWVDMLEDEYWGVAPDMGAYEYVVVDNDNSIIENGKLKMENYPNPFNPVTTIAYQIAEVGNVKLEVFNIKGQKVSELINEQQDAGNHSFTWNADNMNSGIYFIHLTSGGYQKTSKVVLLK